MLRTLETGQTPSKRAVPAIVAEAGSDIAPLYARVADVIPPIEWPAYAPIIRDILAWKKKRNAVILAHNYMTPEIFHCVSDFVGDSLQLAIEASKAEADVIVQAGVHFMAETSKLMSPDKTVLIPDMRAGCSLAASITGEDVRQLKAKYPGVPVVTYVNTSAEVKAESDICCTSSNAVQVVESLGVDRVLMIPDEYLAQNVARETDVEVLTWHGRCEVHERFSADEVEEIRDANPGIVVLAHPECSPEVVSHADFSGSTAALIGYVKERRPQKVAMLTECSMSDNVAAETPGVDFVRPCNLCPHMKRITLQNILQSLKTMSTEVKVDADMAARARQAVERMIEVSKVKAAAPQTRLAATA